MITKYKQISFTIPKLQHGYYSVDATFVLADAHFYYFLQQQDFSICYTGNGYALTDQTTTGFKFPGSQDVNYKTSKTGFWFTISHLVKNDLNGHFPTDQPGQPFTWDIREHAGIVASPFNRPPDFFAGAPPGFR